jgi:hypothetical protein
MLLTSTHLPQCCLTIHFFQDLLFQDPLQCNLLLALQLLPAGRTLRCPAACCV